MFLQQQNGNYQKVITMQVIYTKGNKGGSKKVIKMHRVEEKLTKASKN